MYVYNAKNKTHNYFLYNNNLMCVPHNYNICNMLAEKYIFISLINTKEEEEEGAKKNIDNKLTDCNNINK